MTQYLPFPRWLLLETPPKLFRSRRVVNGCKCLGTSHNVHIFTAQRKLITASSKFHLFNKTKDRACQSYYLST